MKQSFLICKSIFSVSLFNNVYIKIKYKRYKFPWDKINATKRKFFFVSRATTHQEFNQLQPAK